LMYKWIIQKVPSKVNTLVIAWQAMENKLNKCDSWTIEFFLHCWIRFSHVKGHDATHDDNFLTYTSEEKLIHLQHHPVEENVFMLLCHNMRNVMFSTWMVELSRVVC
jgi:hypothetical protein